MIDDTKAPAIIESDQALTSFEELPDDIPSLAEIALKWLETKKGRTGSEKTYIEYKAVLEKFSVYLAQHSCSPLADPRRVARLAQEWVTLSATGKPLSTSTRNQRIAILSSFYLYAMKQGQMQEGTCDVNPIDYVERPPRIIENAAPHMEDDYANEHLAMIDTSTREGKRDRALIALALTTGRRASELANLTWQDITRQGKKLQAKFHCKGGKVMHDDLKPGTIKALMTYLKSQYGPNLEEIKPESPIFVSYSNNNRGGRLSTQAIADICLKHLEISQVHATRHTFAVNMEKAGASLSEIGDRLGHSNYKVTADYMKQRKKAENKYADELEKMFGIS